MQAAPRSIDAASPDYVQQPELLCVAGAHGSEMLRMVVPGDNTLQERCQCTMRVDYQSTKSFMQAEAMSTIVRSEAATCSKLPRLFILVHCPVCAGCLTCEALLALAIAFPFMMLFDIVPRPQAAQDRCYFFIAMHYQERNQ